MGGLIAEGELRERLCTIAAGASVDSPLFANCCFWYYYNTAQTVRWVA